MKDSLKTLIVVDMQNDFIGGSLKNPDAEKIVHPLTEFIKTWSPDFNMIVCTRDTHDVNYLKTNEGRNLPFEHCIKNTAGWCVDDRIQNALRGKNWCYIDKPTFGFLEWYKNMTWTHTSRNLEFVLVGTCTDICVISNALILKAVYPEAEVKVISNLCAGLSPEKHEAALEVMRSCQVKVVTSKDWRDE